MAAQIDFTNTVEVNNLLFERAADLLFFLDSGGLIRRLSPSITPILGWDPGELLGRNFADFTHPDDRPATAGQIHIDEAGEERVRFRNRIAAKDGTYRWVSWNGGRLGDEEILILIGRDITEEKSADEAVRDSEEKYRMLVEHATDGMAIVQDEIIRYANPRMAELDRSSIDVLIGSSIAQHIHPSDLTKVTERYRQRLAGEKVPALYKAVLMRRDGTPADAELNVCVVAYHGRPAALVMIHDLTAHKHIEEELRKANRKLEERIKKRTAELEKQVQVFEHERDRLMTLLNSMTDAVWLVDADGNILLGNRLAKEQARELGLSADLTSFRDVFGQLDVFTLDGAPVGMETLQRVVAGETLRQIEIRVCNRQGGPVFFRRLSVNRTTDKVTGVTGVVVVSQDITPQKMAEEEKDRLAEQLRQAQKMEAIGALAGGIAHDFNNMLAIILGNAELALDDLTERDGPRQNIEQIVKASKHARDLTKQILTFSRKTERARNQLNLTPLLTETFKMLRGTLPTTIQMHLEIKARSDTVLADPSQMQQILINLATNAAYAMAGTGGELTVGLDEVRVKERNQVPGARLRPGRYVKLAVTDTGTGMTEEVRTKVFEPFFTTKQAGKGTGMGLAVAYGIAKSYGGGITVESTPGVGSTFSVFLPLAEGSLRERRKEAEKIVGGTERVLLVDDETEVLMTESRTLEALGYRVKTAESGEEAWKTFSEEPNGFDVVIADQVMPELTGTDLAKRICEVRPDIAVVLMTGRGESEIAATSKAAGVDVIAVKPLTKSEIAKVVRKALGGGNA